MTDIEKIHKYIRNLSKYVVKKFKLPQYQEDFVQIGWITYLELKDNNNVSLHCWNAMRQFALEELYGKGRFKNRTTKGLDALDFVPLEYLASNRSIVDNRAENRELLSKTINVVNSYKPHIKKNRHRETLDTILKYGWGHIKSHETGVSRAVFHERLKGMRRYLKKNGLEYS